MADMNDVIGAVFSCDGATLQNSDSPDTVANWDSMMHIILLSSLEVEFGISFSAEEMSTIQSIGEVRQAVANKTAEMTSG
jgi:acyl carrier protein